MTLWRGSSTSSRGRLWLGSLIEAPSPHLPRSHPGSWTLDVAIVQWSFGLFFGIVKRFLGYELMEPHEGPTSTIAMSDLIVTPVSFELF